RLGFGAMRLTGRGIWGEPRDHDEAIAVLQRALELGVTLIDTADSYGPAVSERLIAEALYPYPPELVIATKGGLERPGPDRWTPNGRPEHLRAACESSLRRLKLERIELYQLHRIDAAVSLEDQLGTLRELQHQGKIRHIGLSEVSVADIERARQLVPIVSVQNRYNLVERRTTPAAQQVLDHCARAERSGLRGARSRLTVATRPRRRGRSSASARCCAPATAQPRRTGTARATCFHHTTHRSDFCPPD